jgi:hypothetical protein
MAIVAPEFLTGAPANVKWTGWEYDWRRQQNLTGLERGHATNRKLVTQAIDANPEVFHYAPGFCSIVDCAPVQKRAMNEQYYQRKLDPMECLDAYSSVEGDRSDVIFVSKFDYLWNMSTSVPHLETENDTTSLVNDASEALHPISNSLLFAKGFNSVMAVVGFWNDYVWLCGATNSFDCEFACPNKLHN